MGVGLFTHFPTFVPKFKFPRFSWWGVWVWAGVVDPSGHVGFAIYIPTVVNRSMVPLADTSASGNYKQ